MTVLDIDLLRTFAAVADLANFTEAGDRLGATQSAISIRLKKLEDRLGRRLLDRTPRAVALTPFGEAFLPDARRILAAHDAAIARVVEDDRPRHLTLGVSEHAAGLRLPAVFSALRRALPGVRVSMTLGLSAPILAEFSAGKHDAVLIRRIGTGGEGRVVYRDDLAWIGGRDLDWRPGETVPLVSVARPCAVCSTADSVLSEAGIDHFDAFSSPGLAAVQAAVSAGLGIACLGRSAIPSDCRELDPEMGLPALPPSEIVMIARRGDRGTAAALDRVFEAFRSGAA